MRHFSAVFGLFVMTLAAGVGDAVAQSYPTKPVRVIVPFPPGGGADIIMRAIAQKAAAGLQQQLVIDNRAGASGLIGAELAAKAPPDGYTLVLATSSNFSINPHLVAKRPYHPVNDFAPVGMLATAPLLLAVHPSLSVSSVRDLVALAKKRPGELAYGSNGTGSLSHLATVLFASVAGIEMLHVPYKGGTPAVTDTVSGNVSLIITAIPTLQAQVRAQRLRALALTGSARSPLLPGLPTVAESGLAGFEAVQWYGVFAPAGTGRETVDKVQQELAKATRAPEIRDVLARDGAEARDDGPEALAAFLKVDFSKWEKVVRQQKIN